MLCLGVQAFIGILGLEFAWSRTKRMRSIDEARDSQFPAFRRTDVTKWARWKFYPGAMLVMPARLILIFINITFLTLFVSLFSIGHNYKKGPMNNGCRKWMIQFAYQFTCSFILIMAGMRTESKYLNIDYSYYLGPDYKKN